MLHFATFQLNEDIKGHTLIQVQVKFQLFRKKNMPRLCNFKSFTETNDNKRSQSSLHLVRHNDLKKQGMLHLTSNREPEREKEIAFSTRKVRTKSKKIEDFQVTSFCLDL